MSHGIKKSTFIEADEQTTKALTYDMLDNLYEKLDELVTCQKTQSELCNCRFKKLESKKHFDTFAASTSGFLGGMVAMAAYYIKQWLSAGD
jgi:thymidine phosphorylase